MNREVIPPPAIVYFGADKFPLDPVRDAAGENRN